MKALLSIALYMLLAHSALAQANPENLSVKINLNYKNTHQQYIVNNQVDMKSTDQRWMIVRNQQPSANDEKFVLLSKAENANTDQVTLKFLLLEAGKNPAVISSPRILVRYGQQGAIKINNKTDNMQLAVVVTK